MKVPNKLKIKLSLISLPHQDTLIPSSVGGVGFDLLKNLPNNDYLDTRLVSPPSLRKNIHRHLTVIQH